jgi:hypothetical protein
MRDEVAVNPDAAEAAPVYLFAMERTPGAAHREDRFDSKLRGRALTGARFSSSSL